MITSSKFCFRYENSLLFSALKGDNYATIEKVYCFTSSSQFLRLFKSTLRLGCIAQSLTCLTADPGVTSLIPVRPHTFVEIDPEIISTAILLPCQ